jgi:hypothetical protein
LTLIHSSRVAISSASAVIRWLCSLEPLYGYHCFHLLGGELAGSKRGKEQKRKSDKDKGRTPQARRRGRRGTIHHNGITSMPGMGHTLRCPQAWATLNWSRTPQRTNQPRRRLCKDGPEYILISTTHRNRTIISIVALATYLSKPRL